MLIQQKKHISNNILYFFPNFKLFLIKGVLKEKNEWMSLQKKQHIPTVQNILFENFKRGANQI